MTPPTSIDDVILKLDSIIEWSKESKSRVGYFATLYRRMTAAVRDDIRNNVFEDPARMEAFDMIFASRYLQAWDAYSQKQKCSNAWHVTFDACNIKDYIVLQHLLLGISTHINLDLAIAAAECCPGEKIYSLQNDFEKINTVITSLVQTVQDELCAIWFPLKFFADISNNRHKPVINFSIDNARKASWANAVAFALVTGEARDNYITGVDNTVTAVARRIMKPRLGTRILLKIILWMENKDVRKIIDILEK